MDDGCSSDGCSLRCRRSVLGEGGRVVAVDEGAGRKMGEAKGTLAKITMIDIVYLAVRKTTNKKMALIKFK